MCISQQQALVNPEDKAKLLMSKTYGAGAVQFLFQLPDGRKFIHCGDMRFGNHLMSNEHLQRFVGADGVFLDTTYCKAKHQFPPQVHSHLSQ